MAVSQLSKNHTSRHPNCSDPIWNITYNYSTCSNSDIVPNPDPLNNRCTNPNPTSRADFDFSGKVSTRTDVHTVCEHSIMIYSRSSIDDSAKTSLYASLNSGLSENYATGA